MGATSNSLDGHSLKVSFSFFYLQSTTLLPPAFARLRLQEDRVFHHTRFKSPKQRLVFVNKRLQEDSHTFPCECRRDHRLRVLVLFRRISDPT